MKTSIHTLQDTLAFQLQGLYSGEKTFQDESGSYAHEATSEALRQHVVRYRHVAESNVMKIERIFDYLMQEPEIRKNWAVTSILGESKALLSYTDSPHLRDIIIISLLQNINAYKITTLKTAYMFAIELDLDTASDMLQQILEVELELAKALASTAIDEFNKGQEPVPV